MVWRVSRVRCVVEGSGRVIGPCCDSLRVGDVLCEVVGGVGTWFKESGGVSVLFKESRETDSLSKVSGGIDVWYKESRV